MTPLPGSLRAAVCATAGALMLTACSGGSPAPAPSSSTTPTSTTTSSATSSSKATPSSTSTTYNGPSGIPAAARAHTDAGAVAFAKYYVHQINETGKNPKVGVLEPLALPTCKSCKGLSDTVISLAADNQRYTGDSLKNVRPVTTAAIDTGIVEIAVSQPRIDTVSAGGNLVDFYPAEKKPYGMVFFLSWQEKMAHIKNTNQSVMRTRRWSAQVMMIQCLILGLSPELALAAETEARCPTSGCLENDGAYNGMTKADTSALPRKTVGGGKVGAKEYKTGTPYQYNSVLRCAGNGPARQEFVCPNALSYCQAILKVPGPWVLIYRRVDAGANTFGPWEDVGTTCYPEVVPGKQKPQLTLAMIEHEWKFTPFAKPQLSIQPVHNRTLVTLPTYFQATWPNDGYQPGEIRTVTLVGHAVRIKPTLKSNTYVFGDGTTSAPTTSLGGTYPTGDIRHSYNDAGQFSASVRTTYSGQYSVDGGDWVDLDGTTVVAGPGEPLQVLTSTNRLY